ncbi:MAG TPA: hypothetical protein VKW08_04090 [Xanthobacteraceae bacterium]|nr:hypothetical protein [Xanthobacteraceae bacterium]
MRTRSMARIAQSVSKPVLKLIWVLAASAVLTGTALPQDVQPENEESRFSFFRAGGGGFLRLDSQSGQVSLCTRREAGWVCQAAPEERTALEAEIARLQAENAALKKEVLLHGLPLPGGVSDPPTGSITEPRSSDDTLRKIVSAMESVWQRFVATVASVRRDLMERS